MIHIEPNQIEQFERSHAETGRLAHHGIDIGEGCNAFRYQMRGLKRVGAADLIDEEARRILDPDRFAAHALTDIHQRVANSE